MHYIRLVTLFLILSLLGGCAKKDNPVLEDGTPVFKLNGTIDQQSVQLTAGKDDYFMYTDYQVNNDNVYEFVGDMKRICSNCKESLRIIIRNSATGTTPVNPDLALYPGEYFYLNPTDPVPTSFRIFVNATSTGTGTVSHLWTFDDGTTSTRSNLFKAFSSDKNHMISYTASYSNGCSSNLSFPIGIDPYNPTLPRDSFSYLLFDTLGQTIITLNASGTDTTNSDFYWDFGDGSSGSGRSITHTYSLSGVYKVTMTQIRLSTNDTLIRSKNVATLSNTDCKANFDFKIDPIIDPLNLSTVTVKWTDAKGTVYSSENAPQRDISKFIINGVSPYIVNDRGQKTRSLDITFSCYVSNGTQTIELKNITGHIAVAYP